MYGHNNSQEGHCQRLLESLIAVLKRAAKGRTGNDWDFPWTEMIDMSYPELSEYHLYFIIYQFNFSFALWLGVIYTSTGVKVLTWHFQSSI